MGSYDSDAAEFRRFYEGLSPDERNAFAAQLSGGILAEPQPGPQTLAFESKADVVGYGGAAGGGKTALLAMCGLLKHRNSVVYRSDKKQLEAFVDLLVQFRGGDVGLNRQTGVFRFAEGKVFRCAGLGTPLDEQRARGKEYDFLGFDEATEMTRQRIEFVGAWCRSPHPDQQCQIMLTFNPPGSPDDASGGEGRWVIDYFAPWLDERHPDFPAVPGELRYYMRDEHGDEVEVSADARSEEVIAGKTVTIYPKSRTFIPARVTDNRYLAEDRGYVSHLASLPEPHRSRFLLGDFRSGVCDAECQIIPTAWLEASMNRWEDKYGKLRDKRPRSFGELSALGVDVSRGGRADTAYCLRHGLDFAPLQILDDKDGGKQDGPAVGKMALDIVNYSTAEIFIDSNGAGASPFDWLRDKWPTTGVLFQSSPKDLQRFEAGHKYFNMRAALWWTLRLLLDPARDLDICIPPDSRLRSELVAPKYNLRGGKLCVEDKDDLKRRLGLTFDRADALLLTLRNIEKTVEESKLKPKHNYRAAKSNEITDRRIGGSWMSR